MSGSQPCTEACDGSFCHEVISTGHQVKMNREYFKIDKSVFLSTWFLAGTGVTFIKVSDIALKRGSFFERET